jgi:hypothetical protein
VLAEKELGKEEEKEYFVESTFVEGLAEEEYAESKIGKVFWKDSM